ncbi:hypothetical protein ACFYOT_25950 [Saccharothrix saharensis]|uniref:hypothetical protein n=1 Tax=Saccharothrix saharensis TaxID=571190 RepID=UPI0036BE3937
MGTVVGLTFLFGFGVLNLALRLGVPVWVAPLVAPAVDLSVLGLLLGIRHLTLAGATAAQLRPARRLLNFASLVTLAFNVADPLLARQYGKAAFDAVGPLLLIGWAEVGPGLLHAMSATCGASVRSLEDITDAPADRRSAVRGSVDPVDDRLLERARQEDARHWERHRRPIPAETLRKRLGVGAARSRLLVSIIRSEQVEASVLCSLPAS